MPRAGIIVVGEVESTQSEARRRLAAGQQAPLWIMARRQMAGRGRKGREWFSQEGNLALSALLIEDAPRAHLPQLSFVAALAAHKALRALAGRRGRADIADALRLKWPNDILLGDEKLGGILLESEARSGRGGSLVIIGWGMNLAGHPEHVRWPATSLAAHGLTLDAQDLAGYVQDSFARWHDLWRARGFAPVRAAWQRRAWGLGERLGVNTGKALLSGIFRELGEDGALMLETANGKVYALHAGEVERTMPGGTGEI